MKKYELTDETMKCRSRTLHRIKALVTIPGVVKFGDLGGWVESEENLSHDCNCWVYGNARVFGNSRVFGNATVREAAWVFGNSRVFGNAEVHGHARVFGNSFVYDNSCVCGDAKVYGNAEMYENAIVYDNASVYGDAWVYGNADVSGDAEVCQRAKVCGYTKVFDGHIVNRCDCITVGPIGSRDDFTTFNLSTGMVCTGCFKGTLGAFKVAVRETHGDNEHGKAYNKLIAYFKTLIDK